MNKFKESYIGGKFPECYIPCVPPQDPIYDICGHGAKILFSEGHKEYNRCEECFRKFGFIDCIE